MSELPGDRLLPSNHKFWKNAALTLSTGHRLEAGEVILDEPAWWAISIESPAVYPAVYAVKARSVSEGVGKLCAAMMRELPPQDNVYSELYPDGKWAYDGFSSFDALDMVQQEIELVASNREIVRMIGMSTNEHPEQLH